MREAIYRGMSINAVVMFAIFGGLAGVAPELIPALLGDKWNDSGFLCSLLALLLLVRAIQVFTYPALLAAGITLQYLYLNLITLAGSVVACLIGVRFGASQVVVGLIVVSLLMTFPRLNMLKQRIGLSPAAYWRPCIAPACAAGVMILGIRVTNSLFPSTANQWIKVTSFILIGASLYLGVLRVFWRARLRETLDTLARAALGRGESYPS